MLAGLNDEEMAEQRPRRALVQYAAAALLAELKHLAAPVSIHLPPLDLDVEDHGTVAPSVVFTTRRALQLLDTILTCEAQMAIDLMDVQGVPEAGQRNGRGVRARARPPGEACPDGATPAVASRRRAPRCADPRRRKRSRAAHLSARRPSVALPVRSLRRREAGVALSAASSRRRARARARDATRA